MVLGRMSSTFIQNSIFLLLLVISIIVIDFLPFNKIWGIRDTDISAQDQQSLYQNNGEFQKFVQEFAKQLSDEDKEKIGISKKNSDQENN